MKKFMNSAGDVLKDSLNGLVAVHSDILILDPSLRFVARKVANRNKVALISGGGSGHEPLHTGYVGYGMLDAACPGQVFTSPTPDQIVAAVGQVSGDAGTLFVVKNYDGDLMNFEMAQEMLSGKCAKVVVDDDVSVRSLADSTGRRGVAGTMIVEKIIGAAAEEGHDLNALRILGEDVNARTRSMGVAFSSGIVPATGLPSFTLNKDEMEMGVGIHGEPGRHRVSMASANAIAQDIIREILGDLKIARGQECLLLVNGFGATPLSELYTMANAASRVLTAGGLKVARSLAGSYVTSLDTVGCSITVTVLNSEIIRLWDAPVHTAALRWGN